MKNALRNLLAEVDNGTITDIRLVKSARRSSAELVSTQTVIRSLELSDALATELFSELQEATTETEPGDTYFLKLSEEELFFENISQVRGFGGKSLEGEFLTLRISRQHQIEQDSGVEGIMGLESEAARLNGLLRFLGKEEQHYLKQLIDPETRLLLVAGADLQKLNAVLSYFQRAKSKLQPDRTCVAIRPPCAEVQSGATSIECGVSAAELQKKIMLALRLSPETLFLELPEFLSNSLEKDTQRILEMALSAANVGTKVVLSLPAYTNLEAEQALKLAARDSQVSKDLIADQTCILFMKEEELPETKSLTRSGPAKHADLDISLHS